MPRIEGFLVFDDEAVVVECATPCRRLINAGERQIVVTAG